MPCGISRLLSMAIYEGLSNAVVDRETKTPEDAPFIREQEVIGIGRFMK